MRILKVLGYLSYALSTSLCMKVTTSPSTKWLSSTLCKLLSFPLSYLSFIAQYHFSHIFFYMRLHPGRCLITAGSRPTFCMSTTERHFFFSTFQVLFTVVLAFQKLMAMSEAPWVDITIFFFPPIELAIIMHQLHKKKEHNTNLRFIPFNFQQYFFNPSTSIHYTPHLPPLLLPLSCS